MTAPPPAAHLVASPSTLNFNVEVTDWPPTQAKTITITNDGNAPSGVLGLPDLDGLLEPGVAWGTSTQWMVGNYGCNQSLAPGASCQFDLQFEASVHRNAAPWTGDLTETASPGGTAHVSVTAQYTSKLLYDVPLTSMNATAASAATRDVVVTNGTAQDMTVSSFNLNVIGGMPPTAGSFSLGSDAGSAVPPCTLDMTLHGGESCQWMVTYADPAGDKGTNFARLDFTLGGIPGIAEFTGVGSP
jgi:hypothetical protein